MEITLHKFVTDIKIYPVWLFVVTRVSKKCEYVLLMEVTTMFVDDIIAHYYVTETNIVSTSDSRNSKCLKKTYIVHTNTLIHTIDTWHKINSAVL